MSIINPSPKEAEVALEKYPYFAYEALMLLRETTDPELRDRLRRIIAANVGDPIVLAEILGLNTESLADFYPDSLLPHLSTIDTIDTFLQKYGDQPSASSQGISSPHTADAVSSVPASVESVADMDLLSNEAKGNTPSEYLPEGSGDEISDKSTNDATFSAIDAFLKAVPPPQPKRPKPVAPVEETPALTEQFAKILIKNQNFTKALQIIQELNLKNPEKSVYFADQIRFLKKLIINQQKRNH